MSSDKSGKASFICLKINFVETYPEMLSELTRWLKMQVVLTERLNADLNTIKKLTICKLWY